MILDWKPKQNNKSIPRSCGTPPHPVCDGGRHRPGSGRPGPGNLAERTCPACPQNLSNGGTTSVGAVWNLRPGGAVGQRAGLRRLLSASIRNY